MKKIVFCMMILMLTAGCLSQLPVSETTDSVLKSGARNLDLSGLDTETAKQLTIDAIESDIRNETDDLKDAISVSREKDAVIVLFRGEYTFEESSAKLSPQIASELDRIARLLSTYPKVGVRVEGHSDNLGPEWYNLKLSRLRAEAVKSIFIKNNFSDSLITVAPFGESFPIASNSTEEGRKINRRIVIRVNPF